MNLPRWLLEIFWLEDRALSRLSGGRWTLPNASGGSVRTLFLHTEGRKTGQKRRNGLYYVVDGRTWSSWPPMPAATTTRRGG